MLLLFTSEFSLLYIFTVTYIFLLITKFLTNFKQIFFGNYSIVIIILGFKHFNEIDIAQLCFKII